MRTEKELRHTLECMDEYLHEGQLERYEMEQIEFVIDTILYCLNEPVKYNEDKFPEPITILNKEVR